MRTTMIVVGLILAGLWPRAASAAAAYWVMCSAVNWWRMACEPSRRVESMMRICRAVGGAWVPGKVDVLGEVMRIASAEGSLYTPRPWPRPRRS